MSRINFGHSSRLIYDKDAYNDKLAESVGPANYRLNENNIYNCDQCLSTLGPRTALMGNSVSTPVNVGFPPATAQKLTDISSILSNRNMRTSKARRAEVNDIDVTQIESVNLRLCDNFLNPSASRLTNPTQNYRDMAINRFYDIDNNPQRAIFWNSAIDSKLEAKDNYCEIMPKLWKDESQPRPEPGYTVNNIYKIPYGTNCSHRFH